MKLLSILLVSLISIASQAQSQTPVINFKCMAHMPTTTFIAKTEGSELVLTTIHHNGVNFMPIHEGVIVPRDIGYLKEVASHLTKMGDYNEFRFPLKNCQIDGPKQMSCGNGNSQNFSGQEMRGFFLYTSKLRETAFGTNFDRIKVVLSVHILNFAPVQDIVMNYEVDECKMDF